MNKLFSKMLIPHSEVPILDIEKVLFLLKYLIKKYKEEEIQVQ